MEEKHLATLTNSIFMFSVMWSFGASVDTASRKPFDVSFKKLMVGDILSGKRRKNVSYPEKATLFDHSLKIKERLLY